MRILHLSNDHYPAALGGTEIYVARLIEAQQRTGPANDVRWAVHRSDGGTRRQDDPDGVRILLPEMPRAGRLESISRTAEGAPGLVELLGEFGPDVVHLHSFSPSCGLTHARAAKAAGAHLVVSVHAPGFSCATNTLIDMNGDVCDGRLRPRRCTSCLLQDGGLARPIAAAVSLQRGRGISTERADRLSRVLTFRRLVEGLHGGWRELTDLADALHVLTRWHAELLSGHDIPAAKVHHVASAGPGPIRPRVREAMEDGTLRVVYWGRCEAVKGIHLVVDAVRSLPPDTPVTLDVFTDGWDHPYGRSLLRRIGDDPRIVLHAPLPQDAMLDALRHFDLGVVPSTGLETGPLTVLEAFAAGLPVAGSPFGGIAELLDGVPGTHLIDPDSRSWAAFLSDLCHHPSQLRGLIPPRTRSFIDVAQELSAAYASRS